MSKRSYNYPKRILINNSLDFKGFKIPEIGRQFSGYNSKDKDGKLPYLYESSLNKIQQGKSNIL